MADFLILGLIFITFPCKLFVWSPGFRPARGNRIFFEKSHFNIRSSNRLDFERVVKVIRPVVVYPQEGRETSAMRQVGVAAPAKVPPAHK